MVHREVAKHTGLNLNLLRIGLPLHLVACLQLLLCHHAETLEHLDALLVKVALEDLRARLLHIESALLGLDDPLVAVAVAVEADGLAGLDVVAQHVDDGVELGAVLSAGKLLLKLGNLGVDTLLEVNESLSHGTVQGNHGTGAVSLRTHGAELEAVACKGEGRRAVAVGIVDEQFGNLRDVHLQSLLASHSEDIVHVGLLDVVEQFAHLLAEERRHDGGRCLVGTQTVGVGGTHDAGLQQSVVLIDAHQGLHDERCKAQVLLGSLARSMQQDAVIGAQAPVVVLTATVDAIEGLFVQQHTESVLAGNLLHQRHQHHVVVDGQVGLLEDRSQLKLVGSHLVMTRLTGNAQFQGGNLQVLHKGLHALGDGTEVVVVHLLVLGRVVTHQGTACQQQVGTCSIQALVHEEVLLLPSQVRCNLLDGGVEIVAHIHGSHVHGMQGPQQRCLIVECLTAITDKHGRNTQCIVDDEHG